MYSNDEIMQFVNIVVEVSDPDKIILFGSYAYGVPTDESDIDLLVIKNGKELSIDDEVDLAYAVFQKKMKSNIKTRYDIFFNTEHEVKEIAERSGAFIDALQRGKVVYVRRD